MILIDVLTQDCRLTTSVLCSWSSTPLVDSPATLVLVKLEATQIQVKSFVDFKNLLRKQNWPGKR